VIISDVSVRRPVFAAVISLVLIIVGVLALDRLTIREYPDVNPPIVSIDTRYRGASAEIIERRITQVIENEIAGIAGVEKMKSSSQDERSSITVEFNLDRNPDDAANDVRERVSRILRAMPEEADPPQITKQDSGMDATMYVDLSSEVRSVMDLTDLADRTIVDRLSVINGVATVRINGGRRQAMRIWLDRSAMAARGITVQDIESALRSENIELPAGRIESTEREFSLRTDTGLKSPEEFSTLILGRTPDGNFIRLGDVSKISLEPESARMAARSNGVAGVSMGIVPQTKANILAVNEDVKAEVKRLQSLVPADVNIDVNVDFSISIRESMKEVLKALGFSLAVVLVVIFMFLGSLRATIIPAVTIPVALIATFIVMAAMEFSINTLTLLGMVLAIGLVVDDAIVVLENIVRRMEDGQPTLLAAIDGSREIGFAVIATTVVLISVFVPISFMPGALGMLFGEFGISLAAAVGFSSLVALTLVPMLVSKLFAGSVKRGARTTGTGRFFKWLTARYRKSLLTTMRAPWLAFVIVALATAGAGTMFNTLPTEYAPTEDRGMIMMMMRGPEGATPAYMDRQMRQVEAAGMKIEEAGYANRVISRSGGWGAGGDVNSGFVYTPLVPWKDRDKTSRELQQILLKEVNQIPGARVFVFLPPTLAIRGQGNPVSIVLGGTDYAEIAEWRDTIMARVREDNPNIVGMRSDYYETKPKLQVSVDRNRAAALGVSLETVGRTLETMLGARFVTTFIDRGEEYNVMIQADPDDRATPSDLRDIYVRSANSSNLVPLANLVQVTETSGARELKRFDRLRAITLTAGLAPGYSLAEALDYMETIIAEEIPEGVTINYDGESREYKKSGGAIYFTFGLALVLCFLVLAAQFESFRHPLIIMLTVPLALFGGFVGLKLFDSTINVFSQIGSIMLIGLAAKNGILIVEFANQLRDRGVEFKEAIVSAASVRLRPVIMTSLCTAGGAVPLMLAFGAGAEARRTLGAVVFFGVLFSVLLTLYVVPSIYLLMARNTKSPEYVSRLVDKLKSTQDASASGSEAETVTQQT
jgi:multidrug efflux pump